MSVRGRLLHRRRFLRNARPVPGSSSCRMWGWRVSSPSLPRARARIALVRTSDRKGGVARALGLLDPAGVSGKRGLLKPNFNTAGEAPASTHDDTLSQLIYELRERGAREITPASRAGRRPRGT